MTLIVIGEKDIDKVCQFAGNGHERMHVRDGVLKNQFPVKNNTIVREFFTVLKLIYKKKLW